MLETALTTNAIENASTSAKPVAKSFIETQFPVSLLSKECYKERKAGAGQTLTALGSYWKGRKPLILVRACILGSLLPSTDNPKRDREIFLKLMLMDGDGLRKRRQKTIPADRVLAHLGASRCEDAIEEGKWKKGASQEQRAELQERAFRRMGYDEKLEYCLRPEEMPDDAWDDVWPDVNRHLDTQVSSLPELVEELGIRRFGHRPRVADTFCGGGSIPFEAARMGCDVHASDLNPVAAMLTWGALNVIGAKDKVTKQLTQVQQSIAARVRKSIDKHGVEEDANGWRAKVYLYCLEVKCPRTGWMIPLAPSWVISETHSVIAELIPDEKKRRFNIEIVSGVPKKRLEQARQGTIRDGLVYHPLHAQEQFPIRTIRGDGQQDAHCWGNRLRLWTKDDFVPHLDDIYQERLYCIQWTRKRFDKKLDREITETEFRSVDREDLKREDLVRNEVARNLSRWQRDGIVPDSTIEPGDETTRLFRERGWTHWHHLFNPRQLLTLALYKQEIDRVEDTVLQGALGIAFCKMLDYGNRLCPWHRGRNSSEHVFYDQALNPLYSYSARGLCYLENLWLAAISAGALPRYGRNVQVCPSANHNGCNDIFVTDPPYADAVNYHEITEFFIAWLRKNPPTLFSPWKWDSRRALAVKGDGPDFRRAMVDAYQALSSNMPESGLQIVMFTHLDVGVWADLGRILWSAGLQVTGAWCIGTEASNGLRQGNYIQGTVLLVLRKCNGTDNAWSNRLGRKIRSAVESHLEQMMKLDDREQPNFGDADYQLGAYAAALQVLTRFKTLDGQDVMAELLQKPKKGDKSTVEKLLDEATRAASEFLVPRLLDVTARCATPGGLSAKEIWSECTPEERFYLKGLELECRGESQVGAFQEIARGFAVNDYKNQMAAVKANVARLRTARECKGVQLLDRSDKTLHGDGFGNSVVRHALYGIYIAMEKQDLRAATSWFEKFMPDYWDRRKRLVGILEYLATATTPNRAEEACWARDLAGAVLNHGS